MTLTRLASLLACAACAALPSAATASPAGGAATAVHVFRFVDRSRSIRLPDGRRVARPVETVVRYPAAGGPYPLIVFGHGFALVPGTYRALLEAWARAGYVVAAPVFPLENAHAPGGPNEADLVDQPADLRFVISRLLRLDRSPGRLSGKIDPARIAVAGHSDGAETALAAAYDPRYRDPRIRAAIILSGAAFPGTRAFPRGAPPLLAVQGTADPINAPGNTASYFALARRPKFLLWLVGASHLPPYTTQQPQLGIVERTTLAFLDRYLRHGPLGALLRAGRRPGVTRLVSEP